MIFLNICHKYNSAFIFKIVNNLHFALYLFLGFSKPYQKLHMMHGTGIAEDSLKTINNNCQFCFYIDHVLVIGCENKFQIIQ